jgi:DNA polymerase-3 subunit alpha
MKVVVVLWIMLLKYGANQVAQIITYGKMATKSAFEIPLVYWIYLFWGRQNCKLIPAMMPSKWNLARFISESEDEVKKEALVIRGIW